MCEHSTVSQNVSLRREARRRKILENSMNRLKLIEGINSSSGGNSLQTFSEPEIQNFKSFIQPQIFKTDSSHLDVDSKLRNLIAGREELKEEPEFLLEDKEDVDDDVGDLARGTQTKDDELPLLGLILEKRLHYVLLALIVNGLLFFNAGYFFYENIFCPFFTLKLAELFTRRGGQEQNLFTLLLVAGLPTKLQKYATVLLSVLPALVSDLLLYIFVFVIGTKILNIET